MHNFSRKTSLSTMLLAASWITATAAIAHEGHSDYAAGEPGDPKKPSREITVVMTEMDYTPSRIEVTRGEQIKFIIRNDGGLSHEFMLATTAQNLKHAAVMRKNPDMEHDDPNGVTVAPHQSAEILWKFSKAGSFEYSCLIPDHRDYGMLGTVTVK